METNLVLIKQEIEQQVSDPATMATLCQTTFKGLQPSVAKQALLEGVMRGFKFQDFLEKNIYAIPFGSGYSLVTSIDYARKIGMRSGVVGKSAPTFEEKDGKIISCSITIKRKVQEYIGDFTATVFFAEYDTKKNQWLSKPRTMIAKVAEMHALRMACPEEMSQNYIEEEFEREKMVVVEEVNIEEYKKKLEVCKDLEELKTIWASLPAKAKTELTKIKDDLKTKYENSQIQQQGGVAGSEKN